jgi:hypothetical protein
MKIAKCIGRLQGLHPAFRINKFYELIDVVRSGSRYYLLLRLENGLELMENPEAFMIVDREFDVESSASQRAADKLAS